VIRSPVFGGLQESGILRIGDFGHIEIERVNMNAADRGVVLMGSGVIDEIVVLPFIRAASEELASGDEHHAWLGREHGGAKEQAQEASRRWPRVHRWE
jgi:hypothetical protein